MFSITAKSSVRIPSCFEWFNNCRPGSSFPTADKRCTEHPRRNDTSARFRPTPPWEILASPGMDVREAPCCFESKGRTMQSTTAPPQTKRPPWLSPLMDQEYCNKWMAALLSVRLPPYHTQSILINFLQALPMRHGFVRAALIRKLKAYVPLRMSTGHSSEPLWAATACAQGVKHKTQEEIAGLSTSKQAVRKFMPLCGQMAEGPVATIVLNWQAREDLRRDMIFGTANCICPQQFCLQSTIRGAGVSIPEDGSTHLCETERISCVSKANSQNNWEINQLQVKEKLHPQRFCFKKLTLLVYRFTFCWVPNSSIYDDVFLGMPFIQHRHRQPGDVNACLCVGGTVEQPH